jgi:hypothetical protein
MTTSGDASTIKFGAGLDVTDEGAGTIRVDSTVELIADVTIDALDSGGFPTGAPSAFDITGIPGTYNDLFGVLIARRVTGSPQAICDYTFNADTGFHYFQRDQYKDGVDNPAYPGGAGFADSHIRALIPGTAATAGQFAHHTFEITGYASTTWRKAIQIHNVFMGTDAAGALLFFYQLVGGSWDSTAAITQLSIGPSGLVDGSRLRLYGRK